MVFYLFTFCSHYYSLLILESKTLEIDFPIFYRIIAFYSILKAAAKHVGLIIWLCVAYRGKTAYMEIYTV